MFWDVSAREWSLFFRRWPCHCFLMWENIEIKESWWIWILQFLNFVNKITFLCIEWALAWKILYCLYFLLISIKWFLSMKLKYYFWISIIIILFFYYCVWKLFSRIIFMRCCWPHFRWIIVVSFLLLLVLLLRLVLRIKHNILRFVFTFSIFVLFHVFFLWLNLRFCRLWSILLFWILWAWFFIKINLNCLFYCLFYFNRFLPRITSWFWPRISLFTLWVGSLLLITGFRTQRLQLLKNWQGWILPFFSNKILFFNFNAWLIFEKVFIWIIILCQFLWIQIERINNTLHRNHAVQICLPLKRLWNISTVAKSFILYLIKLFTFLLDFSIILDIKSIIIHRYQWCRYFILSFERYRYFTTLFRYTIKYFFITHDLIEIFTIETIFPFWFFIWEVAPYDFFIFLFLFFKIVITYHLYCLLFWYWFLLISFYNWPIIYVQIFSNIQFIKEIFYWFNFVYLFFFVNFNTFLGKKSNSFCSRFRLYYFLLIMTFIFVYFNWGYVLFEK